MKNIYIVAIVLLFVYLLSIYAINLIPNIRITSIGWFKLCNVSIRFPKGNIRVSRIRIRPTLSTRNLRDGKWLTIELRKVHLSLHSSSVKAKKEKSSTSDKYLSDLFSVKLPKFVFDYNLVKVLVNLLNIQIFGFTISDENYGKECLYFDSIRTENNYDSQNKIQLGLCLINCCLENVGRLSDQKRLVRNAEFNINFDILEQCLPDKKYVQLNLCNFETSLRLGKLNIPNELLVMSNNKQISNKSPKEEVTSKNLEPVMRYFKKLDINIEELNFSFDELNFSVLNSNLIIQQDESSASEVCVIQLNIYLTLIKLFHKESNCLNISSSNFSTKFKINDIIEMTKSDNLKTELPFFDWNSLLEISHTNVTVYYDQLDTLLNFNKGIKNKNMDNESDNSHQINGQRKYQFFDRMRQVISKIAIIHTRIKLIMPKGFTNGSNFNRESKSNEVVTLDIQAILHDISTKNFKKQHVSGKNGNLNLNSIFKLKGVKLNVVGNIVHLAKINALCNYKIAENKIALKFISKKVVLKSLNAAIFYMVRILIDRKTTAKSQDSMSESNDTQDEKNVDLYLSLFEILPSFVNSVIIKISYIEADIICNENLPSLVVYSENLSSNIDLSDFKRGISIRLREVSLFYKLAKKEVLGLIKSVQCYTMSECACDFLDVDHFTDFQDNETDLSDISSIYSMESDDIKVHDSRKIKEVLSLSEIEVKNSKKNIDELLLYVPQIDGRLDTFLVWCSIYAETLVNYIASRTQTPHQKSNNTKSKGKQLRFNIEINSLATVINLPNSVDILLEIENFRLSNCFVAKVVKVDYIRLLGIHPSTRLWTRLLTICKAIIKYKSNIESKELFLEIISDAIKFTVPYQFLFYTVIDNLVTFFKAIKQIKYNFRNLNSETADFQRLMPEGRGAIEFPLVRLQSKRLGVLLDNDPFENELGYIFELGLIEQKERIKKYNLFEKKVEDIRIKSDKSTESKVELSDSLPNPNEYLKTKISTSMQHSQSEMSNSSLLDKIFSNLKDFKHETLREDDRRYTEAEAQNEIDRARKLLNAEISTSWIKKFRKFKEVKNRLWKDKTKEFWGVDSISPIIKDNYKIMDYPTGPRLMGILMKSIDLTLDKARIPDVDKFLFQHGKGQPKLNYSILLPLYIQLKSRLFYIFLKDYPLPVLAFPENSTLSESFSLSGNIVINEKLVYRKEEMRFIYVPFSYADTPQDFNDSDNFYSVYIPRTLTPVKFMMDLECHINTERTSMVTWCKSYQGALSASGTAVDNFTKPQIDDSPIGWWDKISLLVHGRIVFNIANEFTLHMKGSTSPYELSGKGAGFVFSWKDNIQIKVNDSKKTEEFIQIESDSFMLGIPNYSSEQQDSWSFFNHNLEDFKKDTIESEMKKFQKNVIRLTSDEKVRWVGGIEFERNVNNSNVFNDNEERTSDFKAHFEVEVTNPKFPWHPDSYENFRSDYLHFALSVSSKSSKNNSSNVFYFTPLTFHHFFHWWDLLTNYSSMPIRCGNLFNQNLPKNSKHVKMGSHLFTMKYQLIFEPLTISHTYMNYSNDPEDSKKRIAFTGLKGKFSKCSVDLHQRKEWIQFVNKNLGIDNKILHLKMNKGEINIEDADIRFLNAIFEDRAIRGYLISLFEGDDQSQNSTMDNPTSYDDWVKNIKGSDSLSWLDSNDFTELEFMEELSPYPKIEILPFLKCPDFSYYRDFSVQKDGKHPFGNEPCHNCIIDSKKPEDVQIELIDRRIRKLEEKITTKQSNVDLSTGHSSEEIEVLREKLSMMKIIRTGFLRETDSSDSSFTDSNFEHVSSHNLSMYSSRKLYYDMKEFTNSCSSTENCRNRFLIHDLKITWNNSLRDLFLDYSQKVSDRKTEVYFMSKKALDYIDALANNETEVNTNNEVNSKEYKSGEEVINSFHEEINHTSREGFEIENNYLIKLIHPQVQLVSSKSINSYILIISRELELKISSVTSKENDVIIGDDMEFDTTETRYGVLFQDSHVFVREEEGSDKPINSSSFENELLRWADTEVIYDGSWMQDHLVVEKSSMALIFKKPNYLSSEKNKSQHNDITVHLPKIVINATSEQYSTIYYIITGLLLHAKPPRDDFLNRLDNLILLSNLDYFKNINGIIKELQFSIRELLGVIIRLSEDFRRKNREVVLALEIELERRKLELNILMKGYGLICSACKSNKRTSRHWNILVDQVIWHLLDDKRDPFIDFAIGKARFTKMDSFDGSNMNEIEISMIQGFNLQSNSIYPELLMPQDKGTEENIVSVDWKMLPSIGGIYIMQHANLSIQPIKVELNYMTAKKLVEYLFPNNDAEYSESEDDLVELSDNTPSDDSKSTISSTKKSKVPSPVRTILRKYKKFSKDVENESDDSSMKESISTSGSISKSTSSKPSTDGFYSSNSNNKVESLRLKGKRSSNRLELDDDISLIMNRSSKYVSIVDVNISQMKIVVSFKGPKHLQVLNVNRLLLTIPNLNYGNKIWSGEDFINKFKKDIIKAILGHTGKVLGNKFKAGKRSTIHEPLKQIADYASYVSLQDLQSDGRSRDDEKRKHQYTKQYHILQQKHHKKHHHHNQKSDNTGLHPEDIYEYLKNSDDDNA